MGWQVVGTFFLACWAFHSGNNNNTFGSVWHMCDLHHRPVVWSFWFLKVTICRYFSLGSISIWQASISAPLLCLLFSLPFLCCRQFGCVISASCPMSQVLSHRPNAFFARKKNCSNVIILKFLVLIFLLCLWLQREVWLLLLWWSSVSSGWERWMAWDFISMGTCWIGPASLFQLVYMDFATQVMQFSPTYIHLWKTELILTKYWV